MEGKGEGLKRRKAEADLNQTASCCSRGRKALKNSSEMEEGMERTASRVKRKEGIITNEAHD